VEAPLGPPAAEDLTAWEAAASAAAAAAAEEDVEAEEGGGDKPSMRENL